MIQECKYNVEWIGIGHPILTKHTRGNTRVYLHATPVHDLVYNLLVG